MGEIKIRAQNILQKLNLPDKKERLSEIQKESSDPDFWKDNEKASSRMKEMASLQKEIEDAEKLEALLSSGNLKDLEKLLLELEKYTYFSAEFDRESAIVSIHSGQGGVEAMDWTNMLFRMYSRFCEKKGWQLEILDQTPGEEAGIKSISFLVEGEYAYGHLKHEAGVHRLVRQSPFNADKLRQTSFAMLEVIPEIEEDLGLEIKEGDLEWDFFRASSKGGQNVQKVSSAVRLTHKPTGITVTAQSERYQGQNREYALKILRGKLWVIEEERRKKEKEVLKGGYKTPGWGNQIRSYVLHPYKMVKDLRTGFESGNPDTVLDGELDGFIEEELRRLS
ncbi:MAG: Peptide chain release factor 2 [Candidatus Levybacteria bacterium GW2011_GWA2_40_8]|nr:MAG: Peptide chain release factor 2 [Candidatus Levybacteria bacterium GW2011_GWA2_40_8]